MAGVHTSEAQAPTNMPLRVIGDWQLGGGDFIDPSLRIEGWHHSAMFAAETATSHLCGNHLAAVWQVGEGASLRRDA